MVPPKLQPTPIEAFLAPLARLAARSPAIEGAVFWGGAEGWGDQPSELLESEEIAFWAEGLLEEGFRLVWEIVALPDAPDRPDHIRLLVWEEGAPPPEGTGVLSTSRWPVA